MDSLELIQDTLLRIAPKPAGWPEHWHYDTPNELFYHLLTKGWFTKGIRKELFGWDDATDDLIVRPSFMSPQLNEETILKQIPTIYPSYEYNDESFEYLLPDLKPYQRKMQYYLRLMVVERQLQEIDDQIGKLVYNEEYHPTIDKLIFYYIIDDGEFEDTLQEYCKDKGI